MSCKKCWIQGTFTKKIFLKIILLWSWGRERTDDLIQYLLIHERRQEDLRCVPTQCVATQNKLSLFYIVTFICVSNSMAALILEERAESMKEGNNVSFSEKTALPAFTYKLKWHTSKCSKTTQNSSLRFLLYPILKLYHYTLLGITYPDLGKKEVSYPTWQSIT